MTNRAVQGEQEGLESISDNIEELTKKIREVKETTSEGESKKTAMEYQITCQEADNYRHAYERGLTSLQLLRDQATREVLTYSPQHLESESETQSAEEELPSTVQRAKEDWVPSVGDLVFVPDLGKEATLIKLTSKNKAVIRSGFLTITVESTTLQPL